MGAIFQPTLLDWLFGAGIGTNVGAAIVWVPIGAGLGYLWSRTKYWPLHTIHVHLEALHARHEAHTAHLERIGHSLVALHEKLDTLSDPARPPSP